MLKDETMMYEKIDTMTAELASNFSLSQKNVILSLLAEVIAADDRMAMEESNLFDTFFNRLREDQV